MLTWEQKVLRYDPFAGDKDDGGYRVVRDKIVTARVRHRCAECTQDIKRGERVRAMTAIGDGIAATAYSCNQCCDAMASWMDGDEEPMMARLDAGRRKEPDDATDRPA